MNDRSWMKFAACSGAPDELMFPQNHEDGLRGKKICADCPVRDECLAYALKEIREGRPISGLWGGEHTGILKSWKNDGEALSTFVCEHVTCSEFIPAARISRGRPQRYCSVYCRRAAGRIRARQKYAEKTAASSVKA